MSSDAFIKTEDLSVLFTMYDGMAPSLRERAAKLFSGKHLRPKKFEALSSINLEINSGERVGVIGHNGAGKSTLLKCMAGIYPPSEGVVKIKGSVIPLLELGSGFSMGMSARKNIYLNGAILGLSKREMQELEGPIIEFAELKDFADQPLISLSHGMRSRLGFSIASFLNPEILMLDEVFATGDISFVGKAKAKMQEMIDQSHIVLVVSHQEDVIRDVCNRVVVLHHGSLRFDGNPADALSCYHELMKKK